MTVKRQVGFCEILWPVGHREALPLSPAKIASIYCGSVRISMSDRKCRSACSSFRGPSSERPPEPTTAQLRIRRAAPRRPFYCSPQGKGETSALEVDACACVEEVEAVEWH